MDKLSESLSKTISESNLEKVNSELEATLIDSSEALLEATSSELLSDTAAGIVDEVPVLKSILLVPKLFKGISSFLLAKKIIRFLSELDSIPIEERRKFIEELDGNKKKQILENLILIIDKHDQYEKSEIQGKIFKALIKGKINENEYDSLTYIIGIINCDSLVRLADYYNNVTPGSTAPRINTEELYYFSFLSLLSIDNSRLGIYDSGEPAFNKNDLGTKLIDIISI